MSFKFNEKNLFLHNKYKELHASANDIAPIIDKTDPRIPEAIQGWSAEVSSWPILISKRHSEQLSQLSDRISHLLTLIPSLYFNNDEEKLSEYYCDTSIDEARLSLNNTQKYKNTTRLDLILTEQGFRVLEVNFGSAIGGTECQYFDLALQAQHSKFFSEHNFYTSNFQNEFIQYFIDNLQKTKPEYKELSVFLVSTHPIPDDIRQISIDFFSSLLFHATGIEDVKVYTDTIDTLHYVDNELIYKEQRVDSVLLLEANEKLTPEVCKALADGKIFTPDHAGLKILSDKGNLGLLRELAERNCFSEADNKLVLECIPWTKNLIAGEVTYRGKDYDLLELVEQHKDSFVIKPRVGFQGKDAVLGKYASQGDWQTSLGEALQSGNFVVQEVCKSIECYSFTKDNEYCAFTPVWGSFSFGEGYGGSMLKMAELDKHDGIVNGSTGIVALVYEEQ
ncbi:hypothetical protein [Pseudoalteromonas umbrosa]|uniref:hypothetical protein n=1 Tax=Pseudoalteromonas umbrosa TaxID=3048489 RepID=UPI0024C28E9C|nr:hypothetical protein [Pseudoalteromonas sp. B95]MDK1288837.1 hypothetical protein [Pseudoalteromonas sp. B95]